MRELRGGITAFGILCGLVLCGGCRSVDGWVTEEVVAYAEGPLLEKVEQFVSETVGEEFREWEDAADTDRDGDASWAEWWSFLGGSGGLALLWWLIRIIGDRRRTPAPAGTTDLEGRPRDPEPAVVLPGGRQPPAAPQPRPWYEIELSTASPVSCPAAGS